MSLTNNSIAPTDFDDSVWIAKLVTNHYLYLFPHMITFPFLKFRCITGKDNRRLIRNFDVLIHTVMKIIGNISISWTYRYIFVSIINSHRKVDQWQENMCFIFNAPINKMVCKCLNHVHHKHFVMNLMYLYSCLHFSLSCNLVKTFSFILLVLLYHQ